MFQQLHQSSVMFGNDGNHRQKSIQGTTSVSSSSSNRPPPPRDDISEAPMPFPLQGGLGLEGPMGVFCPRPCFCRCHRVRTLLRTACDEEKCRRNIASRRTSSSWSLDLPRWLAGYGVCWGVSITAALRPRRVLEMTPVWMEPIDIMNHHIEKLSLKRRLERFHPLDEFEGGTSPLNVSESRLNWLPVRPVC